MDIQTKLIHAVAVEDDFCLGQTVFLIARNFCNKVCSLFFEQFCNLCCSCADQIQVVTLDVDTHTAGAGSTVHVCTKFERCTREEVKVAAQFVFCALFIVPSLLTFFFCIQHEGNRTGVCF